MECELLHRAQQILKTISQPALVSRRYHLLAYNCAFHELLQCPSQNYPRLAHIWDIIHPHSRLLALQCYMRLMQQQSPDERVTLRLLNHQGQSWWCAVHLKPLPSLGNGALLTTMHVISNPMNTDQIDYRSWIEQLPIGVYRTLPDSTIVFANQQLAELLGFASAEELIGQKAVDFYADPAERQELVRKTQQGQDVIITEVQQLHRRGRVIWVRDTMRVVRDEDGTVLYYHGSLEDITAQKEQAEQMQQRNQELEMLHSIAVSLGSEYDLSHALDTLLEYLQLIIPYDSASVVVWDEELQRMTFAAHRGFPSSVDLEELEQIISRIPGEDPAKYQREVNIIDDVRQSEYWKIFPGTEYIRSWMGIPLHVRGQFIGVLNLDHHQPGFFTKDYAEKAIVIAQQLAATIENARLYQQAHSEIKRREEAQQVLVQNLITTETLYWSLERVFHAQNLTEALLDVLYMLSAAMLQTDLFLVAFDPATGQLLYKLQTDDATTDIWKSYCELLGLELEPDTMPDADFEWPNGTTRYLPAGQRALLAVVNKRGLLAALRPPEAQPFSESERELLIAMANQVSIAIENERLYRQLKEHSLHLERKVNHRTQELLLEQRRLQAILDGTAEGIFYMEDFHIKYANPAFCRMVGYTMEELHGKPLSFLRAGGDADEERLNFARLLQEVNQPATRSDETRLRHSDGTEFYATVRFSLVGQPGDEVTRLVGVARDISQEKELHNRQSRFIANAAHELRNPLSSFGLRLHMLRRQPERLDKHLESLDQVSQYLRDLVEEMLDLSRFERGSMEMERNEHVLQSILRQAVDTNLPFADSEQVDLHLELPADPIHVRGDEMRLLQMFNTLIINGINYNRAGGDVWVRAALTTAADGSYNVLVEVADNGIGIEPHLLPDQIFEPFVRPSEGNRRETGMGLALAREIALMHDGSIEAESVRKQGSTFRVSLPLD